MYEKFETKAENEELHSWYCKLKNYKVQEISEEGQNAYIFFTSHGLYYPTTLDEFKKQVVQLDRYEWENISKNPLIKAQASRYIFVRDVYKSWCLHGINGNLNSIEKVAKELKYLTEGKKIITVGSSAGGYMALVFGCILNAEAIYAFAPQISLDIYNDFHPVKYITEYRTMDKISRWLSLQNIIENNLYSEVFLMFPTMCDEDTAQLKLVEPLQNDNCHLLKVKFDKHGTPVYGESVTKILGWPIQKSRILYEKYRQEEVSRERILLETSGICKTFITILGSRCKSFIKRKIRLINK